MTTKLTFLLQKTLNTYLWILWIYICVEISIKDSSNLVKILKSRVNKNQNTKCAKNKNTRKHKKSSYRIGNANGVGVRLMIKSAEADNLSVTDSVNGLILGSRVWQTPLFSRRTESDRCLISKVADVCSWKNFARNFQLYFEVSNMKFFNSIIFPTSCKRSAISVFVRNSLDGLWIPGFSLSAIFSLRFPKW